MAYILRKKPEDPSQNLEIGTQVFSDAGGNPISDKPANPVTFSDQTRAREQNQDLDIEGLLNPIRKQGQDVQSSFDLAKQDFMGKAGPSNVFDQEEQDTLLNAISTGITPEAFSLTHRQYQGPTAVNQEWFRPGIKEYEQQLSLYGSPSGVQTALKSYKPGLSAGATRFDSDLYLNNPTFKQERQALVDKLANLNTQAEETIAWAPGYAEQRRQEEEALKNASRSYVQDREDYIDALAQTRIGLANQSDADIRNKYDIAKTDIEKVKDIPYLNRKFDISEMGPERRYASRYGSDVFDTWVKPQEYLTWQAGETPEAGNVLAADEVLAFNRANELIDDSERLSYNVRKTPEVGWSFNDFTMGINDAARRRALADDQEWARREADMADKLKKGWKITDAAANANWKAGGASLITGALADEAAKMITSSIDQPMVVTLAGGEKVVMTPVTNWSTLDPNSFQNAVFNEQTGQWLIPNNPSDVFKWYVPDSQSGILDMLRNPLQATKEMFGGAQELPMIQDPLNPGQIRQATTAELAAMYDNMSNTSYLNKAAAQAEEIANAGLGDPGSAYTSAEAINAALASGLAAIPQGAGWAMGNVAGQMMPVFAHPDLGVTNLAGEVVNATYDAGGNLVSSMPGGDALLGGVGGAATAGVMSFATHLIMGGSVEGAIDRGLGAAAGFAAGGMIAGMMMGAEVGSIVPGVGTFIGAVIGSIIGGLGGRVLCRELYDQGLLDKKTFDLEIEFGRKLATKEQLNGYRRWAVPLVKLMRKSKLITYMVYPWVYAFTIESQYRLGYSTKRNWVGKLMHNYGLKACGWLGKSKEVEYMSLYGVKA